MSNISKDELLNIANNLAPIETSHCIRHLLEGLDNYLPKSFESKEHEAVDQSISIDTIFKQYEDDSEKYGKIVNRVLFNNLIVGYLYSFGRYCSTHCFTPVDEDNLKLMISHIRANHHEDYGVEELSVFDDENFINFLHLQSNTET